MRGWRGWLTPLAAAAAIAIVASGSVALSHVISGRKAPGGQRQTAAATWNEAAAWVAAQVSRSARVSCDPVMCSALRAHGFPAGGLEELRPGAAEPRGSDVIVATAAIRRELSGRLSSAYAPAVVASFGSGSAQIDVRVIAPNGADAYKKALRADLAARKAAGAVLARSLRISATARKQLMAGQVNSRLLVAIANVTSKHLVHIVAFGDAGPGAGAGVPLRSAELAWTRKAHRARGLTGLRQMIHTLDAQRAPFRPTRVQIVQLPSGQRVLRAEFTAPSPLGLLGL